MEPVRCKVTYHQLVVKEDIPKLPNPWRHKIKTSIEERLTTSPDLYGKPLRRSLAGHRKLRVGDYRIVFKIVKDEVKILMIAHRSVVYNEIAKRR